MPSYDVANVPKILVTELLFDPATGDVEATKLPSDSEHAAALLGAFTQMLVENGVLLPQEAIRIALHASDV